MRVISSSPQYLMFASDLERGRKRAGGAVSLTGVSRRSARTRAAGSGGSPLGQRFRLSLQPTADDASAHLAIGRPVLREGIVQDIVGFDAERVLDDLGSLVAVVAADGLLKKVR